MTELVKELNPTVSGSFVEDSPAKLLHCRPEFFSEFELVIAAQVRPVCLSMLQILCCVWSRIWPFAQPAAFIISFHSQVNEATAVKLDMLCREHGSKLILARSFGLVGYVRVSYALASLAFT